ncbi:MAG TPA: HEAT repeat domain-containing protein [Bacteroidota bacterium]|nr:HEAT repeat domain-containing protein [Bacteroidota bacterium]
MDETKKHIAALLSDDDPALRRRAAEELGGCTGFAPIAALAAALRDEHQGVRDAASRSLSMIGTENVARAVVEYLADPNITTRNLAAGLLMHLKGQSTEALLPSLYDNDRDVRKFVVDILGANEAHEAVPHLLKLLNDPDDNVLISTVEALGNIRAAAAIAPLIGLFETKPYVQATVAEALGKIGGDAAAEFLLAKCRALLGGPSSDPLILYTVIEALGNVGSSAVFEVLRTFLPASKGKLRRMILHVMISIGERCATCFDGNAVPREILLDALRDEDTEFQISAVKGLSHFPDDDTTMQLLREVSRSESLNTVLLPILEKRRNVLSAIVESLEKRSIEPTKEILSLLGHLVSSIQYPDIPEEFTAGGGTLLQRTVDVVKASWGEATAETRGAAVDALFRLDGDQAVEFLDAVAKEPDPWIRMHVIELLMPLDDVRIPAFLARFLNDEDEMVRDLAASALEGRGTPAPVVEGPDDHPTL